VQLEWSAPEDNTGSHAVSDYVLLYGHPDAAECLYYRKQVTGETTSCTLKENIWPGITYRFAVAAENKAGRGNISDYSESITVTSETGKKNSQLYIIHCVLNVA